MMWRRQVLFNDGFKLVFRNNEVTHGCGDINTCPSQYCAPGTTATAVAAEPARTSGSIASYGTLVWTYEWPQSAETSSGPTIEVDAAMRFVADLGAAAVIDETVELKLMLGLADGDARITKVVGAYIGATDDSLDAAAMARAGRMLSQQIAHL